MIYENQLIEHINKFLENTGLVIDEATLTSDHVFNKDGSITTQTSDLTKKKK